jgi:TatD DNase family protein
MLTDTHAHLTSSSLAGETDAVLARAAAAGVSRIVAIGCDVESSQRCLTLAERYPHVWATVGLHPTYVTEEPAADWLEQLRQMARHPKCVAMGEMGLDFYHPEPEGWSWEDYVARQQSCFEAQLALAASCGKNVIVHQRDRSGTACWEALKAGIAPWQGKLRAVFHCWLHSWEEAAAVTGQGHLISFTGIATYKNAPEVAACAAAAAPGSFMLETDSPYLAPVPHRGKRNEPAFVRATADWIAAQRGITTGALAAMTNAAADSFFGWTAPDQGNLS